jgi:hypothetical protein
VLAVKEINPGFDFQAGSLTNLAVVYHARGQQWQAYLMRWITQPPTSFFPHWK